MSSNAETPLLRKPDLGIICAWQSTFCEMMKLGLVVGGGALLPFRRARADDDPQSPPVQPFQQDLPRPPDHEPVSKFSVGAPPAHMHRRSAGAGPARPDPLRGSDADGSA